MNTRVKTIIVFERNLMRKWAIPLFVAVDKMLNNPENPVSIMCDLWGYDSYQAVKLYFLSRWLHGKKYNILVIYLEKTGGRVSVWTRKKEVMWQKAKVPVRLPPHRTRKIQQEYQVNYSAVGAVKVSARRAVIHTSLNPELIKSFMFCHIHSETTDLKEYDAAGASQKNLNIVEKITVSTRCRD